MRPIDRLFAVVLIAVFSGVSCEVPFGNRSAEGVRAVEVIEAQLGTRLRPDKTIPARRLSDEYRPGDTVYLALRVYGAGTEVPLVVRWYYGERLVDQQRRMIAPDGLSRTAFQFPPGGGMDAGPHQAVILVDGKEVQRLHFNVRGASS